MEEFVLGEDVTDEFEKVPLRDVVVSVRLTRKDAAELARLARADGKTLSQAAREAVRMHISRQLQSRQPSATFTINATALRVVRTGGPHTTGAQVIQGDLETV